MPDRTRLHRPRRLRPSGGYRDTCSFQTTTVIYDSTWWFCEKFLDPRSRTVDQMIQAGRSGRQNIAESSRAAATSSQTELRLLNSEQLAAARIAERERTRGAGAGTPLPDCPLCGKPMALRTAKQGKHAGTQFWGCSAYPECKGARALEASDRSGGSDRSDGSKRREP